MWKAACSERGPPLFLVLITGSLLPGKSRCDHVVDPIMNVDFDTFLSLYCQSPQRKSFRRNCHVHTYLGFCPCCSLRIGGDELCARSFQTPSTITHSAKQRHGAGLIAVSPVNSRVVWASRARWHVCCHDRRWADVEGGCRAGAEALHSAMCRE